MRVVEGSIRTPLGAWGSLTMSCKHLSSSMDRVHCIGFVCLHLLITFSIVSTSISDFIVAGCQS